MGDATNRYWARTWLEHASLPLTYAPGSRNRWTTTHVPAVPVPVFKGPHGLPIGAQLVARRSDDRKLFACAKWIFQELT